MAGALAAELQKRGYLVTGVDLSPEMVSLARRSSPRIQYVVDDIATVTLKCQMDLAICSFDSLNYFVEASRLQIALRNVRDMLGPAGLFSFDMNLPRLYEEKQRGTISREVSGVKFEQLLAYDRETRMATTVFDFGDGRREVHRQRAYDRKEIEDHLGKAGFRILGVYRDFLMKPADGDTLKPIFLAQR